MKHILSLIYAVLTFPRNLIIAATLRHNGWSPAPEGKWKKRVAYGNDSFTLRYYPDAAIDEIQKEAEATRWNPGNKVVQDHRNGRVHHARTNKERSKRNLPTPWNPLMAEDEMNGKEIL